MSELYKKLEQIVSEKFITNNIYVRHAYSRNVDLILQGVPDIVIRPKDAKEISEILKIANDENIPVTPSGGRGCEFGGSKPIGDGGIVLDMKRMSNIVNLDEDNLVVTVEAGISWSKLNEYLSHFGLYTGCMGPGSGMTASVAGGISHHSSGGGGSAKYGSCTNQLVSLEVVLPTGEIIETGSQANKFSKFPFNRFGNGPDLTGLFCGDNGIYGVKTKISLQIFPKPPFANYKTFFLPRKSAEISAKIFTEIRKQGIEVFDAIYLNELLVGIGQLEGMYPLWDGLKRRRGVFFYTIEANSETELDEMTNQLDKIILSKKAQSLGLEISDGNYAKWHYTEQGHWRLYHNLWGLHAGIVPLTAECTVPINIFSKILEDIEIWDMEHADDMKKILEITGHRPVSGSGPIMLEEGNNLGLSCGFDTCVSYYNGKVHKIIDEINMKLWKSLLERVTRNGVQFNMLGDLLSRVMVDIGAYPEEYYNLMKSIKKTLDPKFILSRGKFNFW